MQPDVTPLEIISGYAAEKSYPRSYNRRNENHNGQSPITECSRSGAQNGPPGWLADQFDSLVNS